MIIKSNAFNQGESIPKKYTCDGNDIKPRLEFSDIPSEAKSLALIMHDPDVPVSVRKDQNWTHWMVWNMPADTTVIEEGGTPPGVIGKNTGGDNKYMGPCPPDREHRYFFKLYALDTELDVDPHQASREDVERAMEHHILAQAELMGRYDRK